MPPAQATRPPGIQTLDSSNTADISVRSSTNPRQATAADEAKMQQILSDPKIREILQDEQIQRLFAALRSNPNEAQRYGYFQAYVIPEMMDFIWVYPDYIPFNYG